MRPIVSMIALLIPGFGFAEDISARHCEIFLDKVRIARGSHGSTMADVFVKVRREMLDGKIVRVAFRGRVDSRIHAGGTTSIDWQTYTLAPFFDAPDYFQLTTGPTGQQGFLLSSDYGQSTTTGAFFVETTKGTRYWAHTWDEDGNFRFHQESLQAVIERSRGENLPDLRRVPTTADVLPHLNPTQCR